MKDKHDIEKSGFDILFEHRNKEYGAYFLREQYNRRLTMAFVITCAAFLLLLLGPFIIRAFQNDSLKNEDFQSVLVIEAPIPKGFVTPEVIPPPPPPEKKNTPPIVTKDSIPEEKEEKKKPVEEPPPLTENKNSKDTMQNKANSGKADGDPNEFTIEVDDIPTWVQTSEYPTPQDYIEKNVKMPEVDIVMRHFGTVSLTVIIKKDGTITDATITKGMGAGLNAEALRVVNSMPKWHPAVLHHKPIATYMKLSVNFLPSNQVTGGK